MNSQVAQDDLDVIERQLGRPPRGVLAVAYRTPDGVPAVVKTAPRLPDGTPFPTLYYLTDPRLTVEASRQESAGLMREMTERLGADAELAAAYRRAHQAYLAERDEIESLGTDFSGGGMPDRVKCLHVLMAHALAKGPGVNPLGDEAVARAAASGLAGTAVPADWPPLSGQENVSDPRRSARTMRVAAVDCGTNSIRLLIADTAAGKLADVHREMRIVRLGQGVDATGAFAPEAITRTQAALHDYAEQMRDAGVEAVRMVATSATRDASNREDFFTMARAELDRVVAGAEAEVITGDEEARLSFAGAVGELDAAAAPFLVVDLGGGSTEFVLGDAGGVHAAYSADVGCVRITERYLRSDPPAEAELTAAREFVAGKLAEAFAHVPVEQARTWVGVAGTFTTLEAVGLDLAEYDPALIHLSHLDIDQVHAVCARLIGLDRARRAALGPMHPGRVDVIGGGALITDVLATELRKRAGITQLTVSEHDILDGIALSINVRA